LKAVVDPDKRLGAVK